MSGTGANSDRRTTGPATSSTAGDAKGASVVVTAINVLRCFSTAEPLLGVTEIALQVGLHKSSASRLLATLEKEGLVDRDPVSRKYRLGLGLLTVAGPLLADLDVRRAALPVLQELSTATQETTALVLWSGSQAVTVEQVPSPQQIKHTNPLGTRYQTIESASVQVFLAHFTRETVTTLLATGRPHSTHTAPVDLDHLWAELEHVAAKGFAVNYAQTSNDEVGVAAPVNDHRGELVAAVLVAAPRYRTTPRQAEAFGEHTVTAAANISRRLGAAST
ncbi:IclR family transcriptional regulator [Terracoccus luteus]|uniref:Glycerol operon regulatory protein n=1 Tax=Terracoccus luteus TaxID=53356 RepID=A0A839Q508_9MICO|nr:IclR family transcriptional regulator [Terracoccus luteus]MBB2988262.1 DNA-binding IclR family transcriptional regulator [Terracoccus luteus]MCP2173897.1 DNA-binding IclR family transcriptional regulator [Terracoccus luteus]